MHQVDHNAIKYAKSRGLNPVGWVPVLVKNGIQAFNATRLLLDNGKWYSVILEKPVYYETIEGYIRPLSEITEHYGNKTITLSDNWRKASNRYVDWLARRQNLLGGTLLFKSPFGQIKSYRIARPVLNIGCTVSTFLPDPNPETTSVDGLVQQYNGGTSGTWATFQGGSGSSADDTATNEWPILIQSGTTTTNFRAIRRGVYLFDSSSIDDTDEISGADFGLYVTAFANSASFDTSYLDTYVVTSAPASNTALVAGDYDSLGSTSLGTYSWGSLTTGTYNTTTMTDTSVISLTGVTKLGYRFKADADNTDPSPGASTVQNTYVGADFAEATGTSTSPVLTVTHAAPGGARNVLFFGSAL